jgi:hypothetical protein
LDKHIASIIRVTRIGELGTTSTVTSNWSTILVTLMMEVIIPPKHRFLQEPHGITSQKTKFFIVTAMETSSLT